MYIYVTYNNSTKAVTEYHIVASKQPAYANSTNGYAVNVVLNDNVPLAFYEEYDNYKVTITNDATIATLSIISSANSGIKRKLGGSGLPNTAPYKNLTDEISGTIPDGVTANDRANAIVALPWALDRSNTISNFGIL